MSYDPRRDVLLVHWKGGEAAVNLHFWWLNGMWHYEIKQLSQIIGNTTNTLANGSGENFAELLNQALMDMHKESWHFKGGKHG